MNSYLNILFSILLSCLGLSLQAQIISIDPVFPSIDDTITITYDATQGSAGLVGVGQVYAHTGLITDQSTTPTDWKYVQGNWGTDDPKVKMTALGNDLHQIKYHARSFYNPPANVVVEKFAFVFRNVDGSREGKTATGGDIFYDAFGGGSLDIALLTPGPQNIIEVNESLEVRFASSNTSDLKIFKDGVLASQANGKELTYTIQESTAGDFWFQLEADDGTTVREDSFFVSVRVPVVSQDPPANAASGVVYLDDTTALISLTAPLKNYVHLIGEFNNWAPSNASQMKRSMDGDTWWLELTGLEAGKEYAYQFLIEGDLAVADPYARKILDPWNDGFIPASTYPNLKPYPVEANGIVSVLQTA
ncbi:MAG: Por secretion system protein, partial [Bacteroidota bacterium]